jgi:ubiquinone/menaquinone biosynthesis C-methylase UbiE/DNA-binding transcriptional ArsR family regulator
METLHRIFKTLHEPVRIRILALLEREELAVQDLTEVLDLAQSTVSRHLAILKEAGLVLDRRDGTFVYYRFAAQTDAAWRDAWALTRRALDQDPTARRDADALLSALQARATRTRNWFDNIAPEWDSLRRVFHDDTQRARAITRLVPPDLTVADIGTGTGILARELAETGVKVIAVDHSERMLEAARENLRTAAVRGVEFRLGEIARLPLNDGEVDAAFAHMVLHYVASPAEAIREMARVVRPGGQVIVVDFVSHDREWMRRQLGVLWQGFDPDGIRRWFRDAGLKQTRLEIHTTPNPHGDLPATFIASAERPLQATTRSASVPRTTGRTARKRIR